MFRPLKITLPLVISAGGTRSWAMANSRVDLPQPDSPTMPRNSPAREVEADPVHRQDRAAVHEVVDRQVADLQHGVRRHGAGGERCHLARWTRTFRMLRTGRSAGLPISSNA